MKSLILLAGCGLGDGSCIEEVVLTYLALEKYRCDYQAAALDLWVPSVNHISEKAEEKRNVLTESSRIGRGNIQELGSVDVNDFDCLIIPGGIGLLSNYGSNESVRKLVGSFLEQNKPIATMCAGIDFLRNLFGADLLKEEYEALAPDSFCCDQMQKIYYTPAFRKTQEICKVQKGIDCMIERLAFYK